jgi:hypothetical protein
MRGIEWERVPAEYMPTLNDERIGGKICDEWWLQILTVGGMLGSCRDSEDLQRIEAAWSSLAADIGLSPAEPEFAAFAAQLADFLVWSVDMRGGFTYTTYSDEVNEFDSWAAKAEAWRAVYARVRGRAPSGPAIVPPATPASSAGIGGFLGDARTLLLLGLGAWVVVSLVRRT